MDIRDLRGVGRSGILGVSGFLFFVLCGSGVWRYQVPGFMDFVFPKGGWLRQDPLQ